MQREGFGPSHWVPSSLIQKPSCHTTRDTGLLPEVELDYIKTLLFKLKDGKPLVFPSLMATPSEYDGQDKSVGRFIMQCRIYLQYLTYPKPPELVRVLFMKTFLQGKTLEWAELIFQHRAQEARIVEGFFGLLTARFATTPPNLPSLATRVSAAQSVPASCVEDGAQPVAISRVVFTNWPDAAPGAREATRLDPTPASSARDDAATRPTPVPGARDDDAAWTAPVPAAREDTARPDPIPGAREDTTQPVPSVDSVSSVPVPVPGAGETAPSDPFPVPGIVDAIAMNVPGMRDAAGSVPGSIQFPGVRDIARIEPFPVPGMRDDACHEPVPGVRDTTRHEPVPGMRNAPRPIQFLFPVWRMPSSWIQPPARETPPSRIRPLVQEMPSGRIQPPMRETPPGRIQPLARETPPIPTKSQSPLQEMLFPA
ncbi:hypothetical protein P4O66_013963 [Electrophorus voltai]|uniref:DUF4939 domain-containing protein n=1 Tax=Electrophorus voltai TaxID=2609070 RepID=A0AAD9DQA4_9TELE|nr:hypothetical protein P4O66_013963 [Electrophorus voltai]